MRSVSSSKLSVQSPLAPASPRRTARVVGEPESESPPDCSGKVPYSRRHDFWLPGLLLVQLTLLVISAYRDAPTRDEATHIIAGLYIWNSGRFDINLGNPPLVDVVAAAPTAIFDPEFRFAATFRSYIEVRSLDTPPERYLRVLWLGRLACIPFSLIGGLACYCWAADLRGRFAGRVALVLWCFCPNVLGHGHIVTGDVACTALGILAGYTVWQWLVEERTSGAIIAGISVGMAMLAKMVWLLWLGLIPLLWLIWAFGALSTVGKRRSWLGLLGSGGQMVVVLVVAIVLVNLGYAFEETWKPFPSVRSSTDVEGGPRLTIPNWLERTPIPLPANYLRGFRDAHSVMVSDSISYMRGEWRNRGWWYYYLYGLTVKVPLGTLVLIGLALWVVPHTGMAWRDSLLILTPAAVLAGAISSLHGLSHHFRYFLPVIPFVFVWVATSSHWVGREIRWGKWGVVGCVTATVISTMWQFPHTLSYYNELAGGPSRGHRHLVDSSLDWGQDLYLLRRWLQRHPETAPLKLVYFGSLAPQLVDVEFDYPSPGPLVGAPSRNHEVTDHWRPAAGWYALSANLVCGKPSTSVTSDGNVGWCPQDTFAFFQLLEPEVVLGRSIWIYHVREEQATELSRRFGWGVHR